MLLAGLAGDEFCSASQTGPCCLPVIQAAVLERQAGHRLDGIGCCILTGMDDLFGFPALRIHQPGKLLPSRSSYEIFNGDRELLATATEAESHTRVKLLPKGVPAARVLVVTTAGGEPALTLVTHTREHVTELQGAGGEPVGQIRGRYTKRHYTLVGDQGQTVGKVVGDLGLKHFSVTGTAGAEFARVRKTWAGLTKEMLTPSDHYKVEFTRPVTHPARTLTVMIAIVLDLTLYEPL